MLPAERSTAERTYRYLALPTPPAGVWLPGVAVPLLLLGGGCAEAPSSVGLEPDSATVRVFYIERPIGEERFTLRAEEAGLRLTAELEYTERGSRGRVTSSLAVADDYSPRHFRAVGNTYRFVNLDVEVEYGDSTVYVQNIRDSVDLPRPEHSFPVRSYAPVSGRAVLIAYWERQGRPSAIRAIPGRDGDVIEIEPRGVDSVQVGRRVVALRRYSVDGVVWGREAVWLDEQSRFAALISRIHILPLQAVRSDLVEALPDLQTAAVRDRMHDLERTAATVSSVADGAFALLGARLIDGNGGSPIEDATIVVRDGIIAAAGPSTEVQLPAGVRGIDATGKTVIPGLWDMHGHVSQIEWAPAYLAAGVTTVRDVGGEARFLTAFRDLIQEGRGIGPRLLLAGLVDGQDSLGFGAVTASTADEARAVVDRYAEVGFVQIKVYGQVRADVLRALKRRADERGMTMTGHVPADMTTEEAMEAGMSGVTHLHYALAGAPPGDPTGAVEALRRHGLVVSPAVVWSELLGRSIETPIARFEPGIERISGALALNYESAGSDRDSSAVQIGRAEILSLVRRLHEAGVTIVAGTDAGVPGFSLLRELELYVEAGLSPMEAIRSATLVPARVLGMDGEVGTVEAGKRADLLVLDADPLGDISAIRRGAWVVAAGTMYDMSSLR